jgi:hypothetical protein
MPYAGQLGSGLSVSDAPRSPELIPELGNVRASLTNYIKLSALLRDEALQLQDLIERHLNVDHEG